MALTCAAWFLRIVIDSSFVDDSDQHVRSNSEVATKSELPESPSSTTATLAIPNFPSESPVIEKLVDVSA